MEIKTDFNKYPVVLRKFTSNQKLNAGQTQYDSGTRGDGLCSIWAVLNGWCLLNKTNLINAGLAKRWAERSGAIGLILENFEKKYKDVKVFNIKNIIEMIMEVSKLFLVQFKIGDDETGGRVGEYHDIDVINGYLIKNWSLTELIDQLEKWQRISTIDGDAHFAILSIILEVQIQVRLVDEGQDGSMPVVKYGPDSLAENEDQIIRITTTGGHYDFHTNLNNGDLTNFKRTWWMPQWNNIYTGRQAGIDFDKPIIPITNWEAINYEYKPNFFKNSPPRGEMKSSSKKTKKKSKTKKKPKKKSNRKKGKTKKKNSQLWWQTSPASGKKIPADTGIKISSRTPSWAKEERKSTSKKNLKKQSNRKKGKTKKSQPWWQESPTSDRQIFPSKGIKISSRTPSWAKEERKRERSQNAEKLRAARAKKWREQQEEKARAASKEAKARAASRRRSLAQKIRVFGHGQTPSWAKKSKTPTPQKSKSPSAAVRTPTLERLLGKPKQTRRKKSSGELTNWYKEWYNEEKRKNSSRTRKKIEKKRKKKRVETAKKLAKNATMATLKRLLHPKGTKKKTEAAKNAVPRLQEQNKKKWKDAATIATLKRLKMWKEKNNPINKMTNIIKGRRPKLLGKNFLPGFIPPPPPPPPENPLIKEARLKKLAKLQKEMKDRKQWMLAAKKADDESPSLSFSPPMSNRPPEINTNVVAWDHPSTFAPTALKTKTSRSIDSLGSIPKILTKKNSKGKGKKNKKTKKKKKGSRKK